MIQCQCGGDLRKLKYTWSDKHTLHKKTICNACGMINEWDKFYPDPTMANKRFYHEVITKSSRVVREKVRIIKEPCGCK